MINKNISPLEFLTPGIPDDCFIRGSVPMTKEEIRILTIAKARLTGNEVVYDIGAGTGSIAIEIARLLPEGRVYAIEQNPEGIELIKTNSARFGIKNLELCLGKAPEALAALPKAQRVIIGGSGGSMEEIFAAVNKKLVKGGRLVINAITVESIYQATHLAEKYLANVEVILVSVSKADKIGNYHLMKAQNPIYIISGDKAD